MPGVKAGSIIEYRWKESHDDELADYVRLPGHREIPIEHLVYHLKPLQNPYFPYTMRYMPFNMKLPAFKLEPGGYAVSSVDNLPAYHEEPDAPPESQIGAWALIYYDEDRKENPDKFWKSEGKLLYGYYKPLIKVNGKVKELAAKLTAGSNSPDEQVQRLYEYCQKNLKDLSGTDITEAERVAAKNRQTTADTLERGVGSRMDIRLAFAALAMGAGFDARLAYLSDRGMLFFSRNVLSSYFLNCIDIAVNLNGHWRLYDVTTRYLEPGHVRWQEEGEDALITDGKNPEWLAVPLNDPLASQAKRTGQFHLDEQGNLEGDLTEVLTGHTADDWCSLNQEHSPREREKSFQDSLERRMPGAEVSRIKLSDPDNFAQPVTLQCHLRVGNYATRTGKRLFLDPALFEFNRPARYPESVRKYDVCWRYPWSEVDDVSIQLPTGFTLDHADAPGGLSFDPVGTYNVKILRMGTRESSIIASSSSAKVGIWESLKPLTRT